MLLLGVDEAGRGPVLGPLVVAAFKMPQHDLHHLRWAGVQDSKQLSKSRREELYEWLHEEGSQRGWAIEIEVSAASRVDRAMQVATLNVHEVELFAAVVNRIAASQEQLQQGVIQLDACDSNAERFGNDVAARLKNWPWNSWEVDSRHKADQIHLAVAAASIAAKVRRDSAMLDLSTSLGIDLGSGYPSDPVTQAALPQLLNDSEPADCVRWRWKTVERLWKEIHGTKVPLRAVSRDCQASGQQTLDLF